MTTSFPEPPVDRERIEQARRYLRRKAAEAGPSADPLAEEIRQGIAEGRLRGRDLLRIDAYREQLMGKAERMAEQYSQLSEAEREQLRQRGLADFQAMWERDAAGEEGADGSTSE
jgi:hypothetical protein